MHTVFFQNRWNSFVQINIDRVICTIVLLNFSATPFFSRMYVVVNSVFTFCEFINFSNFWYFLTLSVRKIVVFFFVFKLTEACHSRIFSNTWVLDFIKAIQDFRVRSSIMETKYLLPFILTVRYEFHTFVCIFFNRRNARLGVFRCIFLMNFEKLQTVQFKSLSGKWISFIFNNFRCNVFKRTQLICFKRSCHNR